MEPNGNLAGTRDVASSITSSNVSQLGVAWKVPITGKSGAFGNFASTPVVVGGVAYFQDLDSGVYAVNMSNGKLLCAIDGDMVLTGAGYPESVKQKPTFVAFTVGATG